MKTKRVRPAKKPDQKANEKKKAKNNPKDKDHGEPSDEASDTDDNEDSEIDETQSAKTAMKKGKCKPAAQGSVATAVAGQGLLAGENRLVENPLCQIKSSGWRRLVWLLEKTHWPVKILWGITCFPARKYNISPFSKKPGCLAEFLEVLYFP